MAEVTDQTSVMRQESRPARRRGLLLLVLAAITLGFIYWVLGMGMWTKQSEDFFKSDKPYGAGDFRIKGNEVISVKVNEPEIKFKPLSAVELQNPNVKAQVTEPWMGSVGELLNRSVARVLRGATTGSLTETLREPAQHTAWWVSDNGQEHILGTGWIDYRLSQAHPKAPTVGVYKMFASSDGGRTWTRRPWAENKYIGTVRFLDMRRGYVLGRGASIWRTVDGGEQWQRLATPTEQMSSAEVIREFDVSAMASDGTLWLAGFTARGTTAGQSTIFALPWIEKPELMGSEAQPKSQFQIPGQSVVDMQVRGDKVWVLTRTGAPPVLGLDSEATPHNEVHLWSSGRLRKIKQFPDEVQAGALYVLDSGTLVIDAISGDGGQQEDTLYLSRDQGETWAVEQEGTGAQGVYMDGGTGERWRVLGYSLYRRTVR